MDEFNEVLMRYMLKSTLTPQKPRLQWIKKMPNNNRIGSHENGLYNEIKGKKYQVDILQLLEYSITIILSEEYHNNAPITEFNPDMSTFATCYVRHNAHLGTNYLNFINEKIAENVENYEQSATKAKALKIFRIDLEKIKLHASQCHTGFVMKNVPISEQCNDAEEFILEPCVIVQLPWKSTLLHQWLLATLAEVLVFERSCYELRYWPISQDYYHIAVKIVNICRDLKERIIYGISIMSEMINLYPEKDERIPVLIRDQVVLPSLPLLKFIVSGNAGRIVNGIKEKLWNSSSEHFNANGKIMEPFNYTMMAELQNYIKLIPYNFEIWVNSEIFVPFPKPEFNVYDLFSNTQNRNQNITNNDAKYFQRKVAGLTKDEIIQAVIDIINKEIVLLKRLPGLTTEQVSKFMLDNQDKYKEELSDDDDIINSIIHEAILYKYAYGLLLGYSENSSISNAFFQVINLHLINMERNHLMKLTNLCGKMFNVNPVAICLKHVNLSISDMNKRLANDQFKIPDYESITSDLYMTVNLENEELDELICVRRHAISQMIYDISCLPFHQMSKLDDLFFQHWDFIQYVLPHLIVSLNTERLRKRLLNFQAFSLSCGDKVDKRQLTTEYNNTCYENYFEIISDLIRFYEVSLEKWIDGKEQEYKTVEITKDMSNLNADLYFYIRNQLRRSMRSLLMGHAFVGFTPVIPDDKINFAGFDNINNVIAYTSPKDFEVDGNHEIYDRFIYKAHTFAYNHFNLLRYVAFKTWKVPSIEEVIQNYPEIGQMYFTYIAINEMYLAHDIVNEDRAKVNGKNVGLEIDEFNYKFSIPITRAFIFTNLWDSMVYKDYLIDSVNEMKHLYILLKKSLQKCSCFGNLLDNIYEKFPYYHEPRVRKAVDLYLEKKFDELDRLLPFLQLKDISTICTLCSKESDKGTNYTACPVCIKDKYPIIHYYCSDECKEKSWNAAHSRNHEDFIKFHK